VVVLISGISFVGYALWRLRAGGGSYLTAGLLGGLVSSTATTVVYSRHARTHAELVDGAVLVILLANLVVVVRLAILTWVTAPGMLPTLIPIGACALLPGGAAVAWLYRRMRSESEPPVPQPRNPTELKTAFTFAMLYAAVLVLTAWVHQVAGARGLYAVALVSGLTDVDAITLSTLRLYGMSTVSAGQAATTITVALLSNIGFKLGTALVLGGVHLFRHCALPMAAVAAGALAGLFLFS
jgi:uncharacterized membrane protein (DUF4010 family)